MLDTWEIVRLTYNNLFGIPKNVVDLMAVEPYVSLLAHGYSNRKIASLLEEEESLVKDTIEELLDFEGFKEDLGFDPVSIYKRHKFNQFAFVQEAKSLSPETPKGDIIISYQVNRLLQEIEEKINKYVK